MIFLFELFLCSNTCFSYFVNFADFSLARTLSQRNGFGPIPIYSSISEDPQEVIAAELHDLLFSLTSAVEAPICQITPLMCIFCTRSM